MYKADIRKYVNNKRKSLDSLEYMSLNENLFLNFKELYSKELYNKEIYNKEMFSKEFYSREIHSNDTCSKEMNSKENDSDIECNKKALLYYEYGNEASTGVIHEYLINEGFECYYPKVLNSKEGYMEFFKVDNRDDLIKGYKDIFEPDEKKSIIFAGKGIAIIPLVGYDNNGYRVGYGGGFYDRFMEKHIDLIKVGIAFDFQNVIIDDVKSYDCRMDYIVTNTGYIKLED